MVHVATHKPSMQVENKVNFVFTHDDHPFTFTVIYLVSNIDELCKNTATANWKSPSEYVPPVY